MTPLAPWVGGGDHDTPKLDEVMESQTICPGGKVGSDIR